MEQIQKFNPLSTPTCMHLCLNVANVNRSNTDFTLPQMRDEDGHDQRQSQLAAEASRSYQSACEKRYEHNDNYIGHWSCEKRDTHEEAAFRAGNKSVQYGNKSQKHRDVRNLAPFWDFLANLDSLAMAAGVTKWSRTWTSIFQRTMGEISRNLDCAIDSGIFL